MQQQLADFKITDAMLRNKGVTSMPDIPVGTTAEKKAKFDELARDVLIPQFNDLLVHLASLAGAAGIGAELPDGLAGDATVQAYLDALYQAIIDIDAATLVYKALPASGTELQNKAEYLPTEAVGTYTFAFPADGESWVRFITAEEFAISFAEGTKFLNGAPVFEANLTYELHGKDGVVAVGKVVAG